MTEENAQIRVVEIPVPMTLEEFDNWGNTNQSLKKVLESENFANRIKEGYETMVTKAKEGGIVITDDVLSFEDYSNNIRYNVMANFATKLLRAVLLGNSTEDVENKTILDENWLSGCIEAIVEKTWGSVLESIAESAITALLEGIIGGGDIRH